MDTLISRFIVERKHSFEDRKVKSTPKICLTKILTKLKKKFWLFKHYFRRTLIKSEKKNILQKHLYGVISRRTLRPEPSVLILG